MIGLIIQFIYLFVFFKDRGVWLSFAYIGLYYFSIIQLLKFVRFLIHF